MPEVDEALYFVIEEKNNQVELIDNGIKFLSKDTDDNFFVLPDIGTEIANAIEKQNLEKDKEAEAKEKLFQDFSESNRTNPHTYSIIKSVYTF